MVDRLNNDHKIARKIAEEISECTGVFIDLKTVQINLVYILIKHPNLSAGEIVSKLKENNILVNLTSPNKIRIAVHRESNVDKAEKVIKVFQKFAKMNVKPLSNKKYFN